MKSRLKPPLLLALFFASAAFAGPTHAGVHYLCDYGKPTQDFQNQRWYPEELPLKVYVPFPPAFLELPNPQDYRAVMFNAFQDWSQYFPAFGFIPTSNTEEAHIKVEWREHFGVGENAWGRARYPYLYTDKKGVKRHTSTIYMAAFAQPGTGMTHLKAPFSLKKLLSIATHEVGHALGLPHSKTHEDIMKPGRWSLTEDYTFRVTQQDRQSLSALYRLPRQIKKNPCSTPNPS